MQGWGCELRTVATEQISCCSWMLTHVAAACPSWGWPRGALHRAGGIFDILSPALRGHDADQRGAINTAQQNLAPPVERVQLGSRVLFLALSLRGYPFLLGVWIKIQSKRAINSDLCANSYPMELPILHCIEKNLETQQLICNVCHYSSRDGCVSGAASTTFANPKPGAKIWKKNPSLLCQKAGCFHFNTCQVGPRP